MSAEIIHLWGGPYEHLMRVPSEEDMRGPATIITIAKWPRHWPPKTGKRKIKLTTLSSDDEPVDRQA